MSLRIPQALRRPLHGLHGVASIRRIEAAWLAQSAPGELMARAAEAVAAQAARMLSRMPPDAVVLLLVGPGNNGGDALQAGRLLIGNGYQVIACAVASILRKPPQAPDAAAAWRAWRDDAMSLHAPDAIAAWAPRQPTLVIDGLFGIGLTRALPAEVAPLLDWIGCVRAPVLAIDVPSGIDADTGAAVANGMVLQANVTVTMIADKPGLHTGRGLAASGEVVTATLADPADAVPLADPPAATRERPAPGAPSVRGVGADAILLDASAIGCLLPARDINSHKGTSGDVMVIGGRLGMIGAARLAARGALGAGAGRVWIAGDSRSTDAADPGRPEIMRAMITATDPLPPRIKVVAIGCGLGLDRPARSYLQSVIASGALMVCDADALNLLAATPALVRMLSRRGAPTILTPHPLEAARLLDWPTARVQADRVGAAIELARHFNAVAVIKGAGTVIADASGRYAINASGNPVLATGGSGDVLAGIIAALAAGPLAGAAAAAAAAACAGVWLHGAAGDVVARHQGPAGVPAGMIADALPEVFRSLGAQAEEEPVTGLATDPLAWVG